MFNWFKKVIPSKPEYKKGVPSKCFNGIYSKRDKSADGFLDTVLKNSYLLDVDEYYAYYRMPDRQILQMWIANDCAYINKGAIVRYNDPYSFYANVKDLWNDKRIADKHVARVYKDIADGGISVHSQIYFKEYKRHGHLVKALYHGCISPMFLNGGREIPEEEYKKELAVFLLKEA